MDAISSIAAELAYCRAQVKRFVKVPKCPARDAVLWTWRRKVKKLAKRVDNRRYLDKKKALDSR